MKDCLRLLPARTVLLLTIALPATSLVSLPGRAEDARVAHRGRLHRRTAHLDSDRPRRPRRPK